MDVWIYGYMDGWMDGWMHGCMCIHSTHMAACAIRAPNAFSRRCAHAQVLSVEVNRHLASLSCHNARVCGERVTVLRTKSECVCQVRGSGAWVKCVWVRWVCQVCVCKVGVSGVRV